jgi:hypothetical protein
LISPCLTDGPTTAAHCEATLNTIAATKEIQKVHPRLLRAYTRFANIKDGMPKTEKDAIQTPQHAIPTCHIPGWLSPFSLNFRHSGQRRVRFFGP